MSLLSNKKTCYVCNTNLNIHKHHIYGGANRKQSEKYGCYVYLCGRHHNLSDAGIHFNKDLDSRIKKECQIKFEEKYNHADFMRIFGRNYL